ncbi:MAG: cytochrome C oxidase subunit IV family protein [Rhodococcus sp. (in: high G+C Gram-positive bacteria)]|uniref:cytochrome C oxidase subunit IV family protein n=1 Tax=Rhodococcus sp. TaxID=1831 RepID=UPI003BAEEBC2
MSAARNNLVWAALVAVTLVSWLVASIHGAGADVARTGATVALLLAFLKAWIVGREFMEIRHAPRVLRIAFGGWVVVVGTVLSAMCLLG